MLFYFVTCNESYKDAILSIVMVISDVPPPYQHPLSSRDAYECSLACLFVVLFKVSRLLNHSPL